MEQIEVSLFTELYSTDDNTVIVPLFDRLVGRYSQKDVYHPETKELLVAAGEILQNKTLKLYAMQVLKRLKFVQFLAALLKAEFVKNVMVVT